MGDNAEQTNNKTISAALGVTLQIGYDIYNSVHDKVGIVNPLPLQPMALSNHMLAITAETINATVSTNSWTKRWWYRGRD